MKLDRVSLAKHPIYNEKWVQEQIAADPSILELGDLILKDKERIQLSGGRLDLLLQEPETLKRYEVELQLGAVDESHIIRTIEYWDIERKRYPQYEHCAVIIAEDITSRFLNVIQLFNGHIPLIAIKMTAYQVGDKIALTFVKVIDEMQFGLVEEDEEVAESTDRGYWEAKANKSSLKLVDQYHKLVQEIEPDFTLNYNKYYVGLQKGGVSYNIASFVPNKSGVILRIRLKKASEIDEMISENDLVTLTYDNRYNKYRIKVKGSETPEQMDVIKTMMQKAKENFGREF